MELRSIALNFKSELQSSSKGRKTSLSYIIHDLSSVSLVEDDEVFQVLVIGGTIFRKAKVKREGGSIVVIEKEEKYQPTFRHKSDFEKFIENEIYPDVKVVALNFAYPLNPIFKDGKPDGKLVAGTKGNVFDDLVGREVGTEVEKLIYSKRKQKIRVAVANDTICLLLAGLAKYEADQLAAGVVGTGMNFAFFLGKVKAVNLESANFDKFPQTPEATLIDVYSTNPGKSTFEKEVAGAYLYKHFNLINEAKGLNLPGLHSTQELDQLSQQNGSEEAKIAKTLLMNSASLVACQMAGIMEYKGSDMVFVIEGSLFWLSGGYRGQVKKVLKQIAPKYKAKFAKITESTIYGAAKLVA